MKFNEKLIELRKQKGLSQEELGYKLNVTRQTISKWELGQTTPEMDKLVELSKIFGVTIDELTNEEKSSEIEVKAKNISENKEKNGKGILAGLCILVAILIIISACLGLSKIKSSKVPEQEAIGIFQMIENIFTKFFGIMDKTMDENNKDFENKVNKVMDIYINETDKMNQDYKDSVTNMMGNYESMANQMHEDYESKVTEMNKNHFVSTLEMYAGTKHGLIVKTAIDQIITNNKKNSDQIVTVTYRGNTTSDPTELQKLKTNFKDLTEYEVSYEYNELGYIYQMDIK